MYSSLRIAFSGKARSGKNTCTDYLIQKYTGQELSFSKPLYDILYHAQETCGFKKEKDRNFLQWIGSWGREQESDIWVKLLLDQVKNIGNDVNLFVSDVRFENELNILKNNGWTVIRLVREMEDETFGNGSKQHISETALDGKEFENIIYNNQPRIYIR